MNRSIKLNLKSKFNKVFHQLDSNELFGIPVLFFFSNRGVFKIHYIENSKESIAVDQYYGWLIKKPINLHLHPQ